ncbi:hypothetical protein [Enterococcus phage PEF1]
MYVGIVYIRLVTCEAILVEVTQCTPLIHYESYLTKSSCTLY